MKVKTKKLFIGGGTRKGTRKGTRTGTRRVIRIGTNTHKARVSRGSRVNPLTTSVSRYYRQNSRVSRAKASKIHSQIQKQQYKLNVEKIRIHFEKLRRKRIVLEQQYREYLAHLNQFNGIDAKHLFKSFDKASNELERGNYGKALGYFFMMWLISVVVRDRRPHIEGASGAKWELHDAFKLGNLLTTPNSTNKNEVKHKPKSTDHAHKWLGIVKLPVSIVKFIINLTSSMRPRFENMSGEEIEDYNRSVEHIDLIEEESIRLQTIEEEEELPEEEEPEPVPEPEPVRQLTKMQRSPKLTAMQRRIIREQGKGRKTKKKIMNNELFVSAWEILYVLGTGVWSNPAGNKPLKTGNPKLHLLKQDFGGNPQTFGVLLLMFWSTYDFFM